MDLCEFKAKPNLQSEFQDSQGYMKKKNPVSKNKSNKVTWQPSFTVPGSFLFCALKQPHMEIATNRTALDITKVKCLNILRIFFFF